MTSPLTATQPRAAELTQPRDAKPQLEVNIEILINLRGDHNCLVPSQWQDQAHPGSANLVHKGRPELPSALDSSLGPEDILRITNDRTQA